MCYSSAAERWEGKKDQCCNKSTCNKALGRGRRLPAEIGSHRKALPGDFSQAQFSCSAHLLQVIQKGQDSGTGGAKDSSWLFKVFEMEKEATTH